ncbi:MAG: LysR family transcriptional regulator [Parvibaculum sp.]|nr:LysR family transcriptional regulator [Parvibaculum sp.]
MIELKKIRHVLEVARQGGITKAALSLNTTQSALTRSIQALEGQLGFLVFERGPRGIRLTREGERFVARGALILSEVEDLEGYTRGVRSLEKGRLKIGAAPALFSILWQQALPEYADRYPGIQIEAVTESVGEIGRMLTAGELDFAIGCLDALRSQGDLDVEAIAEIPVSPYVRRGHPLDGERTPSLQELFSYPMVGPSAAEPHQAFLARMAIELEVPYALPHLVIDSFSLITRIVERTDAFSFIFSRYASMSDFIDKFCFWPQWTPLPALPISLAYRAGWQPSRAAEPLLSLLRDNASRFAGPP